MHAWTLTAAVVFVLGTATTGTAATTNGFNVRDFGARGDGVADDTAAIQRTLDAAGREADAALIRVAPLLADNSRGGNGISDSPTPEVVIPPGTYKLTRTLVGGRLTMLRGVGCPTLRMTDPDRDILYLDGGRRCRLENLHFRGGNTQVRLWTRNVDMSIAVIERCRFSDGREGVHTDSLSRHRPGRPVPVPPYRVERAADGIRLLPRDPANLKWMYNSTILKLSECRFANCLRAVWAQTDYTVMDRCEIETAPEMNGAAVYLRGLARITALRGRARVNPRLRQYWFETDEDPGLPHPIAAVKYASTGSISLRRLDLDSDGPGMVVVRSNCIPRSSPRSLIIADSTVRTSGSPENAIVSLAPDTLPNLVVIRNVRERGPGPVKAIACAKTPAAQLPERLKNSRHTETRENYRFIIAACSPQIDATLPPALTPFQETSSGQEAAGMPADPVPPPELFARDDRRVLDAATFPLHPGDDADNTPVLTEIFRAAVAGNYRTVLFPGRCYRLNGTVVLPPEMTVAGAGVVMFRATPGNRVLFRAPNAKRILFRNVKFVDGNQAVEATADPAQPASIGFDFCTFLGQRGTAVSATAGQAADGGNRLELHLRNCLFRCTRGIDTDAARSTLDTLWLHNFPELDRNAFIANRGGTMHAAACLAVPTVRDPEKWARMKPEDFGDDIRWFDNRGSLHLDDARLGGEGKGIVAVFERGGGTLLLEGGFAKFYNPNTRQCVVYCEKAPRAAVIRDLAIRPDPRPTDWELWKKAPDCPATAPTVTGVPAGYRRNTPSTGTSNRK